VTKNSGRHWQWRPLIIRRMKRPKLARLERQNSGWPDDQIGKDRIPSVSLLVPRSLRDDDRLADDYSRFPHIPVAGLGGRNLREKA
jgi:hypothetical protein